ncbi:MAG: Mammalian cell entry related domain protein [bacterium]|nr:Mammalian cell entry related domain protein [bacterium]
MAKRPNPTVVGGFILGGALLMVAAVAIWGSGRLFERHYRYVCYFPGSVNGLQIGAAVKYRGVLIGQVRGMRIRFAQSATDTRIPVFVELDGKRLRELGTSDDPTPKVAEELVRRGLRARLESESFVTGQLYVNLDMFPGTALNLVHPQGGYPEIPTIPTQLEEATKALSGVLAQLKDADIAGTAHSLSSAVEGVNRLVNTPSVAHTLAELPSTVASVRRLMQDLDTRVGKVGDDLQSTLAVRGPVLIELQRTFVDVQRAAQAVRILAEFLQRNPNALIIGKKRP